MKLALKENKLKPMEDKMKELAFKRPEGKEEQENPHQQLDTHYKLNCLIQFLIETGVVDPLDWKAYLVEKKKAA